MRPSDPGGRQGVKVHYVSSVSLVPKGLPIRIVTVHGTIYATIETTDPSDPGYRYKMDNFISFLTSSNEIGVTETTSREHSPSLLQFSTHSLPQPLVTQSTHTDAALTRVRENDHHMFTSTDSAQTCVV